MKKRKAKKVIKPVLKSRKIEKKPKLTQAILLKRLDSLLYENESYNVLVDYNDNIYVIKRRMLQCPLVDHSPFSAARYCEKEFCVITRFAAKKSFIDDFIPEVIVSDLENLPRQLEAM